VIDWVADNWMNADDGIWEVRGGQHGVNWRAPRQGVTAPPQALAKNTAVS
jgi:hypothetical protein